LVVLDIGYFWRILWSTTSRTEISSNAKKMLFFCFCFFEIVTFFFLGARFFFLVTRNVFLLQGKTYCATRTNYCGEKRIIVPRKKIGKKKMTIKKTFP